MIRITDAEGLLRAGAPARDRPPQRHGLRRPARLAGRLATHQSARAQALHRRAARTDVSTSDRARPPRRRPISRRRALGGSLLVMGGLLAACRGAREPELPPTPVEIAATPTPIAPPTPDVAATATARAQLQSLRMPTTEPPTLDPALATDHSSVQVAVQMFEGLTEIDEAGQPGSARGREMGSGRRRPHVHVRAPWRPRLV